MLAILRFTTTGVTAETVAVAQLKHVQIGIKLEKWTENVSYIQYVLLNPPLSQ